MSLPPRSVRNQLAGSAIVLFYINIQLAMDVAYGKNGL